MSAQPKESIVLTGASAFDGTFRNPLSPDRFLAVAREDAPVPEEQAFPAIILLGRDDIFRSGLELLLRQAGLPVSGIASDRLQTQAILAEHPQALILADTAFNPAGCVLELSDLSNRHPRCRILVLGRQDEIIHAPRFLKSGVRGYIMADRPVPELLRAVQTVAEGEIYVSQPLQNHLNHARFSERSPEIAELLTSRELELFLLYGKGFRNAEIAGQTNLSIKTVDSYRQRIKQKLRLRNASEFTRMAIRFANHS